MGEAKVGRRTWAVRAARAVLAIGAVGLAACAPYNLKGLGFGNPFLPQARFYLTLGQPTTGATQTNTTLPSGVLLINPYTSVGSGFTWQVAEYPNDSDPGITINQQVVDYYDASGRPINPALVPREVEGISLYIPAVHGVGQASGNGTGTSNGSTGTAPAPNTGSGMNQPPAPGGVFGSNDLLLYGQQALAGRYPPVLTLVLTVSGVDDNGYPVAASMSVPLLFQATGSVPLRTSAVAGGAS